MGFVFGIIGVTGQSQDLSVVLDQYPILQDGDNPRFQHFAGGVEARGMVDDVVNLPLARFAAGVDERGVLAVNRAGLAVVIRLIVVGIENLYLCLLYTSCQP